MPYSAAVCNRRGNYC